jgi:hypothetical protein
MPELAKIALAIPPLIFASQVESQFPQYYNSELGFGNCAATITPFIAEKSMLCNKPGAHQIAIS